MQAAGGIDGCEGAARRNRHHDSEIAAAEPHAGGKQVQRAPELVEREAVDHPVPAEEGPSRALPPAMRPAWVAIASAASGVRPGARTTIGTSAGGRPSQGRAGVKRRTKNAKAFHDKCEN
ncbi:hypothetical protein [Thauera sp. SDU_THAU2]|uniref:hypothetical protein n=1 Tax=Thauera sp. SDU_THAU2 TaxID=3136633 RepID=UPI00311EAAFA